jgi:hypothetical protein
MIYRSICDNRGVRLLTPLVAAEAHTPVLEFAEGCHCGGFEQIQLLGNTGNSGAQIR